MTLRAPKVKTPILISQIAIEPARLGCPFPAPAPRSWGEGRGGKDLGAAAVTAPILDQADPIAQSEPFGI
jgi:hypothetical protein